MGRPRKTYKVTRLYYVTMLIVIFGALVYLLKATGVLSEITSHGEIAVRWG